MNIMLDNIIFELQLHGGISLYWRELSNRLRQSGVHIDEVNGANGHLPSLLKRTLPNFRSHSKSGPFIYHSSYYRVNIHPSAVNIVTVFDFTHRKLGHGLKNSMFLKQQAFAISRASRVICISNSTRKDLLEFFPSLDPNKIDVVYVGVSKDFCPKSNGHERQSVSGRPYALFVGSRASYKNFDKTVLSVERHPIDLMIAGPSPLTDIEVDFLNSHVPGRWSFTQSPSIDQLKTLYQNALCLMYPSSYEGFGIPVLEGAFCKVPVIACKNSSIPEVAGPSTLLANEPTVDLLSEALNKLISGSWVPDLEAGVIHAAKFSWDRCYQETLQSYERALMGR